MSWKHGLRFLSGRLFCLHADLRVSLRQLRAGQRDSGPDQQMEGDQVPALRLGKAFQEAVGVCGFRGGHASVRDASLRRQQQRRLRRLLRRRATPALT